ncbi:cyanovirin [Chitinimonas arctica]|uniref:Cyanovirin n=1 Tax=Chitinimonas arctica TaxID=2594795 RepID=A0A516SEC1_9NEIS|nr:cyanovirin [Chitinimonas arctica]QDQ26517.1 cyanovirin [Chitinimonas arctica]
MSRFVPAGSYQKTASQINVNLYGKSQRRDQSWIAAGANITNLSGGLQNLDGSLQPENDPAPTTGFVPNGSYRQTTENASVVLSAYCQKRDGSWQWATLDITRYVQGSGDIANINGELMIQNA